MHRDGIAFLGDLAGPSAPSDLPPA